MRLSTSLLALCILTLATPAAGAQEVYLVRDVEPQPLLAQASRLEEALESLGNPLQEEDVARLRALRDQAPSGETVLQIQEILDPYCLAMVSINPEMRFKVIRGAAEARLVQGGWTSFLVKVHNESGTRSRLEASSPNAEPVFYLSSGKAIPLAKNVLSPGQVAERFLDIRMYRRRPMQSSLSGLALEYQIIQLYVRESGLREARLILHGGPGTEDLGFRNALDILFDCRPSVKVILGVKDYDGSPTTASFIFLDNVERLTEGAILNVSTGDRRYDLARRRPWERLNTDAKRLRGIYPLPSMRSAESDEYPDFFFQPQVYRGDGESISLPPGTYDVTYTRGPEYLSKTRRITIPEGVAEHRETFTLERWIHMAKLGWYSGDHHVHGGGCSHYESPAAGVRPEHMYRQVLGEDLNVACVLTWGPCWYHQKGFFEGAINSVSTENNLIRYDVEVSGFPSSHAGHICLLRLKEDDFPGTERIEDWPSWTLPILQWAKAQGGVVGYAHSGWGLMPKIPTSALPNYVIPRFDGIGANEYIVTVTHDAVDFYSTVDTPASWELNMWYHTLNCGFRTRISGETDYPCIFDDRVGLGRSYAKLDGPLDFDTYIETIKEGRNYVSDGYSHIIDFRAGDAEMGVANSELSLASAKKVRVTARVAAYLPEEQTPEGATIARIPLTSNGPYWHLEKARIGDGRKVPIELIVNGYPVAQQEIEADGAFHDIEFEYQVEHSSWMALRIFPSSHTNPIFVLVDDQPIRASRRSAQWCIESVDQCWLMKSPAIREEERPEAKRAYDAARAVYQQRLAEAVAD